MLKNEAVLDQFDALPVESEHLAEYKIRRDSAFRSTTKPRAVLRGTDGLFTRAARKIDPKQPLIGDRVAPPWSGRVSYLPSLVEVST